MLAEPYFQAIDDLGSPALSDGEMGLLSPFWAAEVDRVSIEIGWRHPADITCAGADRQPWHEALGSAEIELAPSEIALVRAGAADVAVAARRLAPDPRPVT
ncbi:MAG TPA: hypothetical protein PLV68_19395, partial [Ilumatobacteraceae bacterium]|nr:hypothetical protein [Ilumatobacteraceae bacterium]